MKNTTGCKFLDEAGIGTSQAYEGVDICMNCPYEECIIKSRDADLMERQSLLEETERFVQCLTCGATETLSFFGGQLIKTQKWQQRGDKIYHIVTCGEAE